jgi:hypothetical protein
MRFSTVLCTVGAFAAAVLAGENPIYHPDGTDMITAGSPYNITWNPTTSGKITLTLRQGESTNLDTIGVIASKITLNIDPGGHKLTFRQTSKTLVGTCGLLTRTCPAARTTPS